MKQHPKWKDRFVVQGINEWAQFQGKWNWVSFTLIHINFEKDVWIGGYELTFVVLGLGVFLRFNNDKALKKFKEWETDVEKGDLYEFVKRKNN
jgi:hypothetical protein